MRPRFPRRCTASSSRPPLGSTIHRDRPARPVFVGGQFRGDRREALGERGVVRLLGERLGPVAGEVEVAAAVVDLPRARAPGPGPRRGTARSPRRASSPSTRACASLPVRCARCSNDTASARNSPSESQRRWFSFDELLHVLGRRAAGAGLEQAAAVHQRHDRQHLGAGAELEDREQVGQVVAQHVAGDRDRVLAAADALERELRRLGRGHDVEVEAVGVVVGQVGVRPSRSAAASCAVSSSQNTAGAPVRGALDGELDPVADRRRPWSWHMRQMSPVLDRCSSSVSPVGVDDAHDAVGRRSRRSCRASRTPRPSAPSGRRWGRCPWWSGRRHRCACSRRSRPGRRRRSCCRGSRPWCPAARRPAFHIFPESRIIAGIEASMITSLGTCRLVMPLSESTIASRGARVGRVDGGLDARARRSGRSRPRRARAETVVRVEAGALRARRRAWRTRPKKYASHGVAEDDRVGDLHHRRLEVQREQHALGLGVATCSARKARRACTS
jgi:hypothetical protein